MLLEDNQISQSRGVSPYTCLGESTNLCGGWALGSDAYSHAGNLRLIHCPGLSLPGWTGTGNAEDRGSAFHWGGRREMPHEVVDICLDGPPVRIPCGPTQWE